MNNLSEEQLIALYQNAEVFILLPQDDHKDIEGFGLVFLEAAADGLPVIASLNSSAEDAVLDEQNGILVPPRDHGAIAKALTRILSDRSLREKFSAASKNFARSMSWDNAAQKYLKIYADTIHS